MHTTTVSSTKRHGTAAFLATAIVACLATPAQAHFILQQPLAYSEQGGGYNMFPYGGAQKAGKCGEGDSGFTKTTDVNNFTTGQTINLSIMETIAHPGHYRVSIAQNEAALPVDPAVTKVGSDECGALAINMNPALPLIADGVFKHTTNFNGTPQTAQIKLPDGFTCQGCLLQVVEFMSNHGAPCFYHHCATVNITNSPVPDLATNQPAADMATTELPPGTMPQGCHYSAAHHTPSTLLHFAPLLILGLALRRRRRA